MKWYDMFTLRGFDNYFWDGMALIWIPWLDSVKFLVRLFTGNWAFAQTESENDVDMNRLFTIKDDFDPYDYTYFMNKEDGLDCNGNKGRGLYCFCQSKGFECPCEYNDKY